MPDGCAIGQRIVIISHLMFMCPRLAVRTGLEPATPGVTGRYSNQLNYRTIVQTFEPMEGIEPTTPRLQITCSGQLSYIGILPFLKRECKDITFKSYLIYPVDNFLHQLTYMPLSPFSARYVTASMKFSP